MRVFNLVVLCFLGCCLVHGEERNYVPQVKHLQILKDRFDCSVYGAVQARTRAKYRELSEARKKILEFAKQSREALVLCGASSKDSRRALQEEELADQCPAQYERWVNSGQNLVVTEIDLNEKYRELQSLAGVISYYCGKMVDVPSTLPPEPTPESVAPPAQPEPSVVTPSEKPS